MTVAADWLQRSIRGHCGITTTAGDCDISSKGVFGLSDGAVKGGWQAAVSECVGKCERCSGCQFVTVSLAYKDCSWYRKCDLDAVAPEEPFRSGAVEGRSRKSSAEGHGRVLGDGHCGTTQLDKRGDCARGERGNFLLAPTAWASSVLPSHDLPVAIAECLQACASCARCKYISVSTRHRDCSWYASCDTPVPAADYYWLSANASAWRAPSPVLRSEGLGVCYSARAPQRPLVLDAAGDGAHAERALARGNVEMRREHVLWLHTINPNNAAECLFTLVSAFARMAMKPTVTWRPLWRPDAQEPSGGVALELLHALLAQLWRDGQPVGLSDGFHDVDASPAIRRGAMPRRGARRVRCYAGADGATTFTPLTQAFAFAPARAAYLSFHAFARRHVHLPVASPVAATSAPVAVVLQRRPRGGIGAGRQIINEAAVLAAVHDAGFAVAENGKAIEPHLLPVAQLIELLGAAKLLVVVHGAAVSNALFLRPGDGAVLEIFPPNMAYGSGYEVCSGAKLLHLPLHLSWADGDPAPLRSLAAFRTSPFGEWTCTANDRHCVVGARWTNDTLAAAQQGCETGLATNWFKVDICTGLARFTDLFVPLGPLATLLGAAARALAIPPSDRPALHGRAATGGRQCPRAIVLAPPPGRAVVSALREHGFCARVVSAPSQQQLTRASLLLSREVEVIGRAAERMALPEEALWLRVFAGDADGSAFEAAPRFAHRGPQILAFCTRHPDERRCSLSDGLMHTLLRVAKARLMPERSAASSFVGPTTAGFGRCVCGGGDAPSASQPQMPPRRLEQTESRDDGDDAVGTSWPVGGRRRGYCAVTDSEDPGDCERGHQGSWGVAIDRIRSLGGCEAQCRQCRRCRFVTFGDGDCSWYASCARLARPAAAAAGSSDDALEAKFVSVRVRAAFGRTDAQQQLPSAAAAERCGYATLLSHPSFLPGTLALLSSLRTGGATLPTIVLATPAALRPTGTAALLRPYAQLHVLDAADEAMLEPSAKVRRVMRHKPSECNGVRAHDANASGGLADAHDCSRWQRLATFAKLKLLEPNVTGLDFLLYLDADTIVRGNLDPVVSGSFPHALGDAARAISAAGDLGYFNSGVMLLRPSRRAFDEVRAMLAAGDYAVADDPSDQDVLIGWSQREPRRWQQLSGKLNLRVSHPAVTHARWEALSSPKVLHFAHHPKPWLAWFGVRGPLEALARRSKADGAAARLLRTWPPITWGVDEQGVHARMSTREKRWSLLEWKDAWNAFVKEAEFTYGRYV